MEPGDLLSATELSEEQSDDIATTNVIGVALEEYRALETEKRQALQGSAAIYTFLILGSAYVAPLILSSPHHDILFLLPPLQVALLSTSVSFIATALRLGAYLAALEHQINEWLQIQDGKGRRPLRWESLWAEEWRSVRAGALRDPLLGMPDPVLIGQAGFVVIALSVIVVELVFASGSLYYDLSRSLVQLPATAVYDIFMVACLAGFVAYPYYSLGRWSQASANNFRRLLRNRNKIYLSSPEGHIFWAMSGTENGAHGYPGEHHHPDAQ